MSKAYFNENDPYAAEWLRNLIAAGHIAPGDVDQRSIEDVTPLDLAGYTQCHFFAGVGVWSYALRRAGWPDSRPVWTGSCPCQPFSAAGKGNGFADERHLWPAWLHLIGQRSPVVVFGEQVSSKDADIWVDLVQTDMEALGYAFGAVPFPSAGVGAPHIRDRLYWLADSDITVGRTNSPGGHDGDWQNTGRPQSSSDIEGRCDACRVADSEGNGYQRPGEFCESSRRNGVTHGGAIGRMEYADDAGLEGFGSGHKAEGGRFGEVRPTSPARFACRVGDSGSIGRQQFPNGDGSDGTRMAPGGREQIESRKNVCDIDATSEPGPVNGRWSDADWLFCRDGKWRAVEPGTFPLANGAPSRVGRLRAYGNAINAEAAEAWIRSYMECRP